MRLLTITLLTIIISSMGMPLALFVCVPFGIETKPDHEEYFLGHEDVMGLVNDTIDSLSLPKSIIEGCVGHCESKDLLFQLVDISNEDYDRLKNVWIQSQNLMGAIGTFYMPLSESELESRIYGKEYIEGAKNRVSLYSGIEDFVYLSSEYEREALRYLVDKQVFRSHPHERKIYAFTEMGRKIYSQKGLDLVFLRLFEEGDKTRVLLVFNKSEFINGRSKK